MEQQERMVTPEKQRKYAQIPSVSYFPSKYDTYKSIDWTNMIPIYLMTAYSAVVLGAVISSKSALNKDCDKDGNVENYLNILMTISSILFALGFGFIFSYFMHLDCKCKTSSFFFMRRTGGILTGIIMFVLCIIILSISMYTNSISDKCDISNELILIIISSGVLALVSFIFTIYNYKYEPKQSEPNQSEILADPQVQRILEGMQ